MKAMLGAFVSSCARARFGADVSAALDSAVRHYDRCLKSDSGLPAPQRGFDFRPDTPLVEVEAELSPSSAAVLKRESARLGVDRQLLLNHAVIVYLADLDRRVLHQSGTRKRGCATLGR